MYKVIKYFTDLEDDNHAYHVGDTFPHEGKSVTKERLMELSSDKNKRHVPLIVEIKAEEPKEVPKEEPKETKAKKSSKRTRKG